MSDPEHVLFLGGDVDSATGERSGPLTNYDPDELVTHGVIVGMTGSGKTGLGIVLLEEALPQGVPCVVVDPKGDLTNLALRFPDLRPEDFAPWLDPATTAGRSPDEVAAETADAWRSGLASWGIGTERVRALAERSAVTIYTPGSSAAVPLNLLGSLAAPEADTDIETRQDEIEGFVSGLLGMAGIEADPLTSPEHILLANLIDHAWAQHCCTRPTGGPAPRSSPCHTYRTRNVSSWWRCCSPSWSPGCGRSPARRRCGRWRTWTRCSDSYRRTACRRPRPPPHRAQAGPGVRCGPGAGHPEPRRPRLQGAVQRGHLAGGQAADQTRQGPPARRAHVGVRRRRSRRDRPARVRAGQAPVRPAQHRLRPAPAVHHPLGDELSAGSADPRPDRHAHRRGSGASGARRIACARDLDRGRGRGCRPRRVHLRAPAHDRCGRVRSTDPSDRGGGREPCIR